jgi:hypothetical protein
VDEDPSRTVPPQRLYPICERMRPSSGGDGDASFVRIGYGIDLPAPSQSPSPQHWSGEVEGAQDFERRRWYGKEGGDKEEEDLSDHSIDEIVQRAAQGIFGCPGSWARQRGICTAPPSLTAGGGGHGDLRAVAPWTTLGGLGSEAKPGSLVAERMEHWTDPRPVIQRVAERGGSNTAIFATTTHAFQDLAVIWSRYHVMQNFPVIVVALDLPSYFYLCAQDVDTVFLPSFAGKHLGPWCVELWKMPAWRSSQYGKALGALSAVRMGVHGAAVDLDVFFDGQVDWAHLAATTAVAHSEFFDFYFAYTSATTHAIHMWQNILLSVYHGAWDQTSWGYWGDRFRNGIKSRKLLDSEDMANRGERIISKGWMPDHGFLPHNSTIRRFQNREAEVRSFLDRALARDKKGASVTSSGTRKNLCRLEWHPADRGCGQAAKGGASDGYARKRLCISILLAVSKA